MSYEKSQNLLKDIRNKTGLNVVCPILEKGRWKVFILPEDMPSYIYDRDKHWYDVSYLLKMVINN